jgi:hypothetical protein
MKRLIQSLVCNLCVASLLFGLVALPNRVQAKDPKEQILRRS